jgi:hypothetical protein
MRKLLTILFLLGLFAPVYASSASRVIKVLPFFLDLQGRNAKSPSLYDRDAYQAYLRIHTNEIAAIRFDVQWKTAKNPAEKTALRLELRGIGERGLPQMKTLETEVTPGTFSQWTNFMLGGDDYKKFGAVVAWRVTLWRGGVQMGEQKSFLW